MKIKLLKEYKFGARTRQAGEILDVDQETSVNLISSGIATREDQAPKKKKNNV